MTALLCLVLMFFVFMVLELRDFGETYQYKEIALTLEEGGVVVMEGKAKILESKLAIPGKLVLINLRLVFQSLRAYKPTLRRERPLSAISELKHVVWKFPFPPVLQLALK